MALATLSQEPKDTDYTKINQAKLLEEDSSPFQLSAIGHAAKICNTASSRLLGYRIGCVTKKDDQLEIVSQGEMVEDQIEAQSGCLTITATHVLFPFAECSVGKLAITEAKLEDGTTWKLKE